MAQAGTSEGSAGAMPTQRGRARFVIAGAVVTLVLGCLRTAAAVPLKGCWGTEIGWQGK